MNRIATLFKNKPRNILSVYCTAGYPTRESTLPVMLALQDNGADMIELGMPYSDPLADGPVIQQSSETALANGMSIPLLMRQLKDFRNQVRIPVILMGYMNPIMQYGFEKFCAEAAAAGIDGLILPDLPEYEFESQYGPIIKKYQLDFIFLVTPETARERVLKLDALSTGFLYAVSSSSTTGGNSQMPQVETYLEQLKGYGPSNPLMVGFGIRDRASFEAACRHAAGAIIGTAYIRALQGSDDVAATTRDFLKGIRPA